MIGNVVLNHTSEETMPLTYSKLMSRTAYLRKMQFVPYTGYNAVLYARWLPYAVLVPTLAATGMLLSLFLPWLSLGNTAITAGNVPITTFTGFHITSSGATFLGDTFSFPLWLLVVLDITLIVLSLLLFKSKILTSLLSKSIRLSFGLAFLVEIVYWFTSLYSSFSLVRGHLPTGVSLAVNPSYGLWACLLVTVIAGGICLVLFSNLSWHWR